MRVNNVKQYALGRQVTTLTHFAVFGEPGNVVMGIPASTPWRVQTYKVEAVAALGGPEYGWSMASKEHLFASKVRAKAWAAERGLELVGGCANCLSPEHVESACRARI